MNFIWLVLAFLLCFLLYSPLLNNFRFKFREIKSFADDVEISVVLDLVAASLKSGAAIPRTIENLAQALRIDSEVNCSSEVNYPQEISFRLAEVSRHLLLGSSWEEAWQECPNRFSRLSTALKPAWNDGAAPVPLLVRSAQNLRLTRQRRAREAAAKLSAKLVLPLATCFLPAFLLVGVLPVIVSAGAKLF
ncbi:MAG: type II secretion system F family protein [Arcanobacterium sp.]|nr:type II secretion system F family protein [Arcanobacterium sp.]